MRREILDIIIIAFAWLVIFALAIALMIVDGGY